MKKIGARKHACVYICASACEPAHIQLGGGGGGGGEELLFIPQPKTFMLWVFAQMPLILRRVFKRLF